MKKILSLLFASLLATFPLFSKGIEIDGICYILESDTAIVTYKDASTSGSNYADTIIIPEWVTYRNKSYQVTTIGSSAFADCTNLKHIIFPSSITYIQGSAFLGCTSLKELELPLGITTIGNYAFRMCTSLESIIIPETVKLIGTDLCSGCSLLTSIIWKARNCKIPDSYASSPFYAISTQIKSFVFGDEVQSVPSYLCGGMTSLKSLIITDEVTTISARAFTGCSNLESITIGKNVKKIEEDVFYNCKKLKTVYWNAQNFWTISDKTESPFYTLSISKIIFGEEVETIPDYLCYSKSIETLSLPKNVKKIGQYAFGSCKKLHSVDLGMVEEIGSGAFNYCDSLKSIKIPRTTQTIENSAFFMCVFLEQLHIGSGLTTIGNFAFSGCSRLSSITCFTSTPPTCGLKVFESVDKSIPLYVINESIELFWDANGWKDFLDIRPISASSVEEITDIQAEVTENSAILKWYKAEDVVVYIIEVQKDGEAIYNISFDKEGYLLYDSLIHKAPRKNNASIYAEETSSGWSYFITGLEENSKYTYSVTAKRDNSIAYQKSIIFKTYKSSTGVNTIINQEHFDVSKIIENGNVYIQCHNGTKYNILGRKVK